MDRQRINFFAVLIAALFLLSCSFHSGEIAQGAGTVEADAIRQNADETRYFEGAINNRIKIVMKLKRDGSELSGDYFYERYGVAISLQGTIDARNNILLDELNNEGSRVASLRGKFTSDKIIEGTWSKANAKNSMPFQLKEIDTASGPAVSFQGSWSYENQGYSFSLDLTQKGNELKGEYCAVTRKATRIDCESAISGTIKGGIAEVKFTSGYSGASGAAIIIHRGNTLLWDMTALADEAVFAPISALMKRTPQKK